MYNNIGAELKRFAVCVVKMPAKTSPTYQFRFWKIETFKTLQRFKTVKINKPEKISQVLVFKNFKLGVNFKILLIIPYSKVPKSTVAHSAILGRIVVSVRRNFFTKGKYSIQ